MSIGPGDAGISVPITADTAGFAAQLGAKLEAALAEVAPEVFNPLVSAAGTAGAKAGTALAAGFTRDSEGRLRDANGRFVSATRAAGIEAGQALGTGTSEGLGRSAPVVAAEGRKLGQVYARAVVGPLRAFGETALAFFAFDKVKDVLVDSVAEAREAQKVGALTNQVLKTTGSVAGVSADQVGDLANQISRVAGIDDETIQSAENLILTFTKVRNEVGAGNDIFNRATQAAVDLSAALHIDLRGAAIQVGKALNDPVKGVTALAKAGVSFTAQQKAQIKSLVDSGRFLEAQKIVLHELAVQTAGAAAAQATLGDKTKVAAKNIEESIGRGLIPVVEGAERAFLALVSGGGAVIHFFQENEAAATALSAVVGVVLVGSLAKAAASLYAMAAPAVSAGIGRLVLQINALYATSLAAGGGLKGAAAAGKGLIGAINPATAAVVGVGAAVGVLTYHWHKQAEAQRAAEQAQSDFFASLHTNLNDLDSIASSLAVAETHYQSLFNTLSQHPARFLDPEFRGDIIGALQGLSDLATQQAAVKRNTELLRAEFGLTAEQAKKAAEATQTDLGGAYLAVEKNIGDYIAKQQQSHHASSVVAQDFADLGSSANSLSDDLSDLDDAWAHLIGNFVDSKEARLTAREDLIKLRAALVASAGSTRSNTEASREARRQLLEFANTDIPKVIDAVYNQTGSLDKARAAGEKWLQGLKDAGAAGPLVQVLTRKIQSYMDHLADAAPGLGHRSGHGWANELSGGLTEAEAETRAALDKIQGWLGQPLRLAFDFFASLPAGPPAGDGGGHHRPSRPSGGSGSSTGAPAAPNGPSGGAAHGSVRINPDGSVDVGAGATYIAPTVVTPAEDPTAVAEQTANRLAAGTVSR